jgi:hypothetical protein
MKKEKYIMELTTYNTTEPTLKEVQKIVGGFVECLALKNGDALLINEEGKLKDLPVNIEATHLLQDKAYIYPGVPFIVGNAVLIKKQIRRNW